MELYAELCRTSGQCFFKANELILTGRGKGNVKIGTDATLHGIDSCRWRWGQRMWELRDPTGWQGNRGRTYNSHGGWKWDCGISPIAGCYLSACLSYGQGKVRYHEDMFFFSLSLWTVQAVSHRKWEMRRNKSHSGWEWDSAQMPSPKRLSVTGLVKRGGRGKK